MLIVFGAVKYISHFSWNKPSRDCINFLGSTHTPSAMCKNWIICLQWICLNILRNAINWVIEAKFLYFFQVLKTIFNHSFACIYMADTERHDKFPYKKTNLFLKKIYWGSRVAPLVADHHQTRLLTNFLHSPDCWICLSRIDQAEMLAWFSRDGMIRLRRGNWFAWAGFSAWFAWAGLIRLRWLPDLHEQDLWSCS